MSSVNLNNLSQDELNKILKEEYAKNKKLKKERSIQLIKKLQKQNEKLSQVKSKSKQKSKSKTKSKRKPKSKQKIKTFDEYFQECIKNKTIPKDTPHYLKKALERAMKEYDKGIKHEKSALSNFAEKYVINGKPGLTPIQYFAKIVTQLKEFLRNHRNIKVRMILICQMERQIIEKSSGKSKLSFEQDEAYFHSQTHINLEKTDVKVILSQMLREIIGNLINYQTKGTGWYFKEVISFEIHTVDYKPIRGSKHISLPDFLMRKKAIINMENKDEKCFLWSVLRYLHPREKHSTRINDLKEYEKELNFKGINFPIKVKDIQKFENPNPNLPGINVFSINDNNKIYPLRLNQKDVKKSIDLFLFSEDENQHYSLIKNFSRLVRSQITSDRRKIHICKKCLTHFTKKYLFKRHTKYCKKNETVAVKMPTKKTIINFQNHFKKLLIPFTIYADFECFTMPISTCKPNPESYKQKSRQKKSYTLSYQKHEPNGYCLYIKALDGMEANFKPLVYKKKTSDEDISKYLSNMS